MEKIAIVIEAAIRISLIAHSFLLHHEFSSLSWYSSHSLCCAHLRDILYLKSALILSILILVYFYIFGVCLPRQMIILKFYTISMPLYLARILIRSNVMN